MAVAGSRKRGSTIACVLGAAALALTVLAQAQGALGAKVLMPPCVVSGNTCTVRMPMTAADNNTDVVIKTPRPNHDAVISDNNHKPFTAMYNVEETSRGITFQLQGVNSLSPGTVLIIVFKLVPAGSTSSSSTAAGAPATSSSSSSSSGSLSLSGPTANKLGSSFSYKLAADAAAPALFLAFEEAGSTCADSASAYSRSSARVHESVPAGSFDATFNLVAEPAGGFALCVYLVNPASGATEAHAAAHWTNG